MEFLFVYNSSPLLKGVSELKSLTFLLIWSLSPGGSGGGGFKDLSAENLSFF